MINKGRLEEGYYYHIRCYSPSNLHEFTDWIIFKHDPDSVTDLYEYYSGEGNPKWIKSDIGLTWTVDVYEEIPSAEIIKEWQTQEQLLEDMFDIFI